MQHEPRPHPERPVTLLTEDLEEDEVQEEEVFCRCCGEDVPYKPEELDENDLCIEHDDAFDRDEDEQKDWDDFVENQTKD